MKVAGSTAKEVLMTSLAVKSAVQGIQDFHINRHDRRAQRSMKAARSAKIKAEAGFSQTLSYKPP
jgi:hypothetical protein